MDFHFLPEPSEFKLFLKKFNACTPILLALADSCRQKLLIDIIQAGKDGINVNTLTQMSHLSRPAISYHLKMIRDCGLVKTEKRGTQIFYSVMQSKNFDTFRDVVQHLNEFVQIIENSVSKDDSVSD